MWRYVLTMGLVGCAMNAAAQPTLGPIQAAAVRAAMQTPITAASTDIDDGWQRVRKLRVGSKIALVARPIGSVTGTVVAVDSSAISISRDGASTTIIPKAEVITVTRRIREGRPVLGATITAIAGFYVGEAVAVSTSRCYDLNCLAYAFGGGAAGAVGGGYLGRALFSYSVDETIYRAP